MKLVARGKVLTPGQIFRVTAVGYAIGILAIFAPILLLVSVFVLFGAPFGEGSRSIFLFPILLPVIAVFQAVIVASISALGLVIYTTKRQIIVLEQEGTPNTSLERTRER